MCCAVNLAQDKIDKVIEGGIQLDVTSQGGKHLFQSLIAYRLLETRYTPLALVSAKKSIETTYIIVVLRHQKSLCCIIVLCRCIAKGDFIIFFAINIIINI